jgi:hypothetical protein
VNPIHDYLNEKISYFEQTAAAMKSAEGEHDRQLDELFRQALREVWGDR